MKRQVDEEIEIQLPDGRHIRVMLVESWNGAARIGVTADRDISVHRKEVADRIREEQKQDAARVAAKA